MFKPTKPPEDLARNMFVVTSGGPGSGKTHLPVFTGVEPIAFFGFDPNYKATVDRALVEGIEIYQEHEKGKVFDWVSAIPDPVKEEQKSKSSAHVKAVFKVDQKAYEAARDRYEGCLAELLESDARTICIDGGDYLWDLYRGAEFGQLSHVDQLSYGDVNKRFGNMLMRMKSINGCDKHVFVTSQRSEIWRKDKSGKRQATGEYKVAGYKSIPTYADLCLVHELDGNIPTALVDTQCKPNIDLIGDRFRGEECTYPSIFEAIWGEEPE